MRSTRSIAELNSFPTIGNEIGAGHELLRIARAGVVTLLMALAPAATAQAARLLAPGGGTVRALVVGINDYPKLPHQSLKGAAPDADDIAAVLEGRASVIL